MLHHFIVTLRYRRDSSPRRVRSAEMYSMLLASALSSSREGSAPASGAKPWTDENGSSQPRTIQTSLDSLAALYNIHNADKSQDLEWLNSCEHIGDRLKFLKALYKNIAILRRSKLRERARSLSNANSSSSIDLMAIQKGSRGSVEPPTSETEPVGDLEYGIPHSADNEHKHFIVESEANGHSLSVPVSTVHLEPSLDNNSESRDGMDDEEDEVEDLESPGTRNEGDHENRGLQRKSESPSILPESQIEQDYNETYVSSPIVRELSVPLPLLNDYDNISKSSS